MSATATYCAVEDVERVLSIAGVADREDDDPAIDDELLAEASSWTDTYLFALYGANLVGNRWVKYCTADIAATLWCERRGNDVPSSIQKKWDRRMEMLERMATGKPQVPGLAKLRLSAPGLSNVRIKLAPVPHTVVERERSGKRNLPQDYKQNLDVTERPSDYQ